MDSGRNWTLRLQSGRNERNIEAENTNKTLGGVKKPWGMERSQGYPLNRYLLFLLNLAWSLERESCKGGRSIFL